VVDSGVDVVILTTPPHFRPVQLAYAVDAGKHVFAEKPVAVDAPGVRSVMKTVEKSQAQGLGLIVGFCWRYSNGERATFAQLEQGAVGEIRAAYTTYNTGVLWKKPRRPGWSDMEFQLRNWLHFHWLTGDHIVEQAVHSIDKMSWAMGDALPLRATAVGGRQARKGPESGNVWDHFGVTYDYPNGARGFHMCRQIAGCSNDNSDYILGARGICRINGWTPLHEITGENPWKYEGPGNDMYQTEHDEFFASIRAGKPRNDGERVAHSTMLAILGRMAAYTGQTVTWEQALHSTERYGPGSYAWTDLPVEPVPVPGVTKLQLPAEGGK
ncbi:MAG: Gfo/Idh/MocA family protein, partial [Planctomycetota bacterium]